MTQRIEKWNAAPWLHFRTIPSTNAFLMELPAEQAVDGMICTAEIQTAGSGRGDRIWISPFGGLYLSILLTPDIPIRHWHLISFVMAVAGANAIKQACPDIEPFLKWPNDILVQGRKVAGVLIQSNSGVKMRLVAGIGINVNIRPDQLPERTLFPAGVINQESAYPTSVQQLAREVRSVFYGLYREWLIDQSAIISQWESLCIMKEKNVVFSSANQIYKGIYAGLSGDGALQLRIGKTVMSFYSGDLLEIGTDLR